MVDISDEPSTTITAPPPKVREGEPPRRPMPAGHVILVAVVALAVGSLLNAKGMLKTAHSLNLESTRRDVSLFFAKPLYDVAHFLRTDRPRAWLQDMVGRSGDDDIASVAGPSPTTPSTTTTTVAAGQAVAPTVPPTAPPRPVFDAAHPLRVYVAGDSLAETPGQQFVNLVTGVADLGVPDGVDFKISSGLARPDYFNWPQHILDQIQKINPNAVVLTFGANDDQAVQSPDGKVHSFGTDGWVTEYRRRVGGLMDAIVGQNRQVFWIGIPVVRDPARWQRYQLIDQIYQSEAAARPGKVFFIPTTPLLTDASGHYADYLPNASGQQIQIRAQDGIHFQPAGGKRIAEAVIAKMHEVYDLR